MEYAWADVLSCDWRGVKGSIDKKKLRGGRCLGVSIFHEYGPSYADFNL